VAFRNKNKFKGNPMATTEAFSRALIDSLLTAQGWNLADGTSVRFEYLLPDGTRADYLLCDRYGRGLAVIEAKRFSTSLALAADQARHYAEMADVPFIFLANGKEILFWDWRLEAHPRPVRTFFKQEDLERRTASRMLRVDSLTMPIDTRITGRDYQKDCIDELCKEINFGRRKLLVEMATGTGKTRTAAALIKRLFQANVITRVLFLVDRIPLGLQTEDAFAEYLSEYPCYVLRNERRFDDAKRVTITTLQSMINIYHEYSAGYFDLVISDECHRSIYGKWKKVLLHFDGIQIGLTATPCVAAGNDTGDEEDHGFVRDTLRFFELERPTYRYTLQQAINAGYLTPYQIYRAKTVATAAEGGFPVRRDQIEWDGLDERTRRELEEAFQRQDPILVNPNALERKFTLPERNRAIVREFRDVMQKGYWDAAANRVRAPQFGKTIVFAVTKAHAETLARMFDEAYADQKPSPEVRYADFVVSGTGKDDTVDALAKIKRFKKEQFPQILVSVNMLDTGFDCPEVMNLVFARYTDSVILYRQMRGRGSRKAHRKPVFTMFDFVGVTDVHQDEDTYGEGGAIRETPPRPRPNPRTVVTVDADDHIDPMTRGWVTLDEDGRMVFAEASEAKANELGLRFEEWLGGHEFTPEQERWLHWVESQIRANAEICDDFTVDHLEFPPFSGQGGRRKAVELFGDDARLAETIAGLSAAVFQNPPDASSHASH
jgi:type I restriction enzyme R subunit